MAVFRTKAIQNPTEYQILTQTVRAWGRPDALAMNSIMVMPYSIVTAYRAHKQSTFVSRFYRFHLITARQILRSGARLLTLSLDE